MSFTSHQISVHDRDQEFWLAKPALNHLIIPFWGTWFTVVKAHYGRHVSEKICWSWSFKFTLSSCCKCLYNWAASDYSLVPRPSTPHTTWMVWRVWKWDLALGTLVTVACVTTRFPLLTPTSTSIVWSPCSFYYIYITVKQKCCCNQKYAVSVQKLTQIATES